MKRFMLVLFIVAVVMSLIMTLPLSAYADKGGVRHKETGSGPTGDDDPCLTRGDCGQGDHGQGDPEDKGKGSEHANCNAAQGEVDPLCPVPTPTPDKPKPPFPPYVPTPTGRLCCDPSKGEICEPFKDKDYQEHKANPVLLEEHSLADWDTFTCMDVVPGTYTLLHYMGSHATSPVSTVTIKAGNTVVVRAPAVLHDAQ